MVDRYGRENLAPILGACQVLPSLARPFLRRSSFLLSPSPAQTPALCCLPLITLIPALAVLTAATQIPLSSAISSLRVNTTSGVVEGFLSDTTPNVAQFLGIPFAEQPVGSLRWLPPSPLSAFSKGVTLNATRFGLSCPQYEDDVSVAPNLYTVDAPEFNIHPQAHQGEECLSLNVWTPLERNHTNTTELFPVIAWIYGGGYYAGGGNVPYQNPALWIERSGKHIVVGINYRLNVLGFPNAAGLKSDEQNLGLLDQRLGLEWIRDNIENFGGDPERITMWGQSAGAISADNYNFAYPDDPIVAGFIMHSGTAMLPLSVEDPTHTNFTFVAEHFGCTDADPEAQVDCLRKVSASDLVALLKGNGDSAKSPFLAFGPVIENRTQFSTYTGRTSTRKPAIIGTTTNEGVSFVTPYNQTYGPDQSLADAMTLQFFQCPTAYTTADRYANNLTTFRYVYAGNFSNIAPQWWEGAYHSSDLPLIFGTYGIARGNGTSFQKQVSEKMQDMWVAFAEDPVNGLPNMGWNRYQGGDGKAPLIGKGDLVTQPIAESTLETPCY